MRRKTIDIATPLLESGETIIAAVSAVHGPKLMIYLRFLAMLTFRSRIIAVTEANVYVLRRWVIGMKSIRIAQRYPRGTAKIWFEPGVERVIPAMTVRAGAPSLSANEVIQPPGVLHIGSRRFWVWIRDTMDAWTVADAAGGE